MSFTPPVSGFNVAADRCVITVNGLSCVCVITETQAGAALCWLLQDEGPDLRTPSLPTVQIWLWSN